MNILIFLMINPKLHAPKVYQLEGAAMDRSCRAILTRLLMRALSSLKLNLKDGIQAEAELIVDFVYYRLTLALGKPLPSHSAENLGYVNVKGNPLSKRQRNFCFVYMVVVPYLWKRLRLQNKFITLEKIVKVVDTILMIIKVGWFLYFISGRNYVPYDVFLWIANISVIQPKMGLTRELDFEVLNRTVIWDSLGGVLKEVLGTGIIKSLGKFFLITSLWGNLAAEDDSGCYICKEPLCVTPVKVSPCNHTFCYYCFKLTTLRKCPKCQVSLDSHNLI